MDAWSRVHTYCHIRPVRPDHMQMSPIMTGIELKQQCAAASDVDDDDDDE